MSDGELASNYSGVGACAANTWASTLNDNAAPTCTQPAFTDISGSVTDAQVPNTITVDLATAATALAANPTDCGANTFATTIAANGNLTCATVTSAAVDSSVCASSGTGCPPLYNRVQEEGANLTQRPTINFIGSSVTCADNAGSTRTDCTVTDANTTAHGALTGLGNDDHTQYTLRAGRTAATNDTTLSTDADGTLYGSSTTAKSLILRANSADLTTGEVFLNSLQTRTPGSLVFDPDATPSRSFILWFDGTETFSGAMLLNDFASGTYTMNNANSTMGAFSVAAPVVLDWTAAPTFASSFFNASPKVRASTAISSRLFRPFIAGPTYDANAVTLTLTDNGMFEAIPTYTITSAGVIAGSQRGFYSGATVGASATLPLWRDFVAADTAGAGTVTTHVGVDVAAFSDATTSIGIRNASTTVYTNTNQAVTAVTDTIVCNSTYKTITLPSGSMSLTSNPSIADGQTGQICIIQNVGANILTLTDATKGMNLAAATRALSSDDTLTLMYGGAAGDWVEIAWADN